MAGADWAVARLDEWLRADAGDRFATAVEELRMHVEHVLDCRGEECGHDWREHHGADELADCDARMSCRDCAEAREGGTAFRPVPHLLDELETREAMLADAGQ